MTKKEFQAIEFKNISSKFAYEISRPGIVLPAESELELFFIRPALICNQSRYFVQILKGK